MIRSTIPVLASLDIDASVEFYTKRLGFEKRGQWDDYAIVSRDGAEIHFWRCAERRIAENTSCYLRAANTHALHAESANAA